MSFPGRLGRLSQPQFRPLLPLLAFVSLGLTAGLAYGATKLVTDKNLRTFRTRYNEALAQGHAVYADQASTNTSKPSTKRDSSRMTMTFMEAATVPDKGAGVDESPFRSSYFYI